MEEQLPFFDESALFLHNKSGNAQFDGSPLAVEKDFDLFLKMAGCPGVVFYFDSIGFTGRDGIFRPMGGGTTTGGAHIVDQQRLSTFIF